MLRQFFCLHRQHTTVVLHVTVGVELTANRCTWGAITKKN